MPSPIFKVPDSKGPWWRLALSSFPEKARRQLRRKFPSIRQQHDDIIGETLLSLTTLLSNKDKLSGLPGSWFMSISPPAADVQRFEGLAYTVLNRRVMDVFRVPRQQFVESFDDLAEHREPISSDEPADIALDRTRATRALLTVISQLSREDRELVEAAALGGKEFPMSARDRQRLRRLRLELIDRLRSRLGQGVLDLFAGP